VLSLSAVRSQSGTRRAETARLRTASHGSESPPLRLLSALVHSVCRAKQTEVSLIMNDNERQQILDAACNVIAAVLPEAWAVYVYGSFARGDEWPDSDLDLAVLLPPGCRIPDKLALVASVSRHIGRDADIVDLREASLDLVHELLRDGRPLILRRELDVLAWEAERMTDYAEFNPRRSDILALYLHGPLRAVP
jgi:uncharacterized protein